MKQSTKNRLLAVARFSAVISLTAAVVVFFAVPDKRWIAAILLAEAVLDVITFGFVLPRVTAKDSAVALTRDEPGPAG